MIEMTTAASGPVATLEISDRRLPARMVAGRFRADLPRPVPLASMPPHRRARLAIMVLMMAVPVVSATRRSQPA